MLRLFEQPRLLAALAVAFAMVPAGMALVIFRDAKQKDERLYKTNVQVLTEQLRNSLQRHTYLPVEMRSRARTLDDAALRKGKMMPIIQPRTKLPHLLAVGYAQRVADGVIIRWMQPMPGVRRIQAREGDDLTNDPAIAAAITANASAGPTATKGCVLSDRRVLAILELPGTNPANAPRGYILGWIDLDSMCRDESLPLIHEQGLTVTPLTAGDATPEGALRNSISDDTASFDVAVARGAKFGTAFSPATPWLALLATGLSTAPLLLLASLAGRSTKLNAALTTEREIARQQRLFTQTVSHEFRTPLGVIMSGTDLLDRYLEHLTPERRNEVLGEIRENTRKMSEMVEQVLMLGRIESSRLPFQPKSVNVATLCADIVRKVKATVGADRPIEVTAPDAEASLDAALLGSVLDNLLSNAIKYSPADKTVTLTSAMNESHVVFTVRDEGIGIPADELARACDPFHRCANVGAAPGTGLGLAITQRCVALQGGTMAIESEVAHGTSVTVTLPLPKQS